MTNSSVSVLSDFSRGQLGNELRTRATRRSLIEAGIATSLRGDNRLEGIADSDLMAALAHAPDTDDRIEVTSEIAPTALVKSRSVAALIPKIYLEEVDGDFVLQAPTLHSVARVCADDRFSGEVAPAIGTTFLVTDSVVLTAAHVLPFQDTLANSRIVFGFDISASPGFRFPAADVFAATLLTAGLTQSGGDWALLRLDRPASGRPIPPRRTTGAVAAGEDLFVLGFPLGLPMKFAGNAHVRDVSRPDVFSANLDTFGGNSGSPVFSAVTGLVEGILNSGSGMLEYSPSSRCYQSHVCSRVNCAGEKILRITSVPI